jgi:hypothetical protein
MRTRRYIISQIRSSFAQAPELGGGYGIADFVVGRCLVEVKASFDPVLSIGDWLNQVVAYALLDWRPRGRRAGHRAHDPVAAWHVRGTPIASTPPTARHRTAKNGF